MGEVLDDNTYTNKTWAEVSGIDVQDIHVMEVEFLSNVRYNLFVSKEEWDQWHVKLSRFCDFVEKASRMPFEPDVPPKTPALQVTPITSSAPMVPLSPASRLPSPPLTGNVQSQAVWYPPLRAAVSYRGPASQSQVPSEEVVRSSRKRSWDNAAADLPSKRVAVSNPSLSVPASTLPSCSMPSVPALPPVPPPSVPNLAVSASLPRHKDNNYQQPPSLIDVPTTLPSQPPTLPQTRAVSTMYNPPTTWSQPMPAVTSVAVSAPLTQTSDVGQRQGHYPVTTSAAAISPSSSFSFQAPQNHLSPSVVLVDRNSPYRPVRAVNTLLIPPPNTSLHARNLPVDQMHYQPLAKSAAERRRGVLPYVHHGAWPQGPFPEPNFPNPPY